MLARRLLLATAGGGSFTVSDPAEAFALTTAPDGSWPGGLGGQPFYANGYTFFGYSDNAGDFLAAQFDHSDGSVTEHTLATGGVADQHNRTSLVRRSSDDRLVAIVAIHGSSNIYRFVSTNPDDVSAWAASTNIDSQLGSTAYSYPFIFELEDESKLYLFYRDFDGLSNWEIATSSDDGATWSAFTNLVFATRAYARAFKTSVSRFDVFVTDGSFAEDFASLYHFYYEGGDYFTSDGTMIAGSPPFDFADLTLVYDGATAGVRYPASHAVVGGEIAVVFPVMTGTPSGHIGEDEDYLYARWDGADWTVTTVRADVGATDFTFTEGSLAVDPADLDHVVISRRNAGGSGTWRIYDYTTTDDGATWTETAVTSSGDEDRYPEFVNGHQPELRYLWLKGTFTDQDTFDSEVWGYGTPT